jgi:glutaredoxin-like protein
MDKLLNEQIITQVREIFDGQLVHPVEILFFGNDNDPDCEACAPTRQLVEEVAQISDKLSVHSYDIVKDAELARTFRVDKTPGLVLVGVDSDERIDYGVRYAGIPAGHEFSSLIHDLILVSGRDSGLSETTRQALRAIDKPVHLQVFVTPTCPYCPQAVILAHRMAMESPMVEAEMIEATEFPDLADRFNVSGVPQTTINQGAGTTLGAVPESQLLQAIQTALAAQA